MPWHSVAIKVNVPCTQFSAIWCFGWKNWEWVTLRDLPTLSTLERCTRYKQTHTHGTKQTNVIDCSFSLQECRLATAIATLFICCYDLWKRICARAQCNLAVGENSLLQDVKQQSHFFGYLYQWSSFARPGRSIFITSVKFQGAFYIIICCTLLGLNCKQSRGLDRSWRSMTWARPPLLQLKVKFVECPAYLYIC